MKAKLRRQLRRRKRRLERRIDKAQGCGRSPMIHTPQIEYQLAERQQGIAAGGIGVILELIQKLSLREEINQAIPLLKLHLPYDEADHVLNSKRPIKP